MDETATIITDQSMVNINMPQEATETTDNTAMLSTSSPHIHTWSPAIDAENILHCNCGESVQLAAKPKHAGGRPCEFCKRKDEIMTIANAYIEKCKKGKDGKPIMPFKEELALELNVIDTTLHDWAFKKTPSGSLEHPEFTDLWSTLNMVQKLRLQQRTMGRFNPTGAIALLKWHHGMIETSKQILAGDKNEPLQITIVEEDRHVEE